MNRLINWLGLVLIVVAVLYFARFAAKHAGALWSAGWSPAHYITLVHATALYCLAPLIGALSWVLFMRDAGEPANPRRLIRIFLLAQFAKYAPGNVFQYFGRIALAKRYAVSATRAAFTLVLETGLTTLCAVLLASVALLQGRETFGNAYSLTTYWQLGLLVLTGVLLIIAGAWIFQRWRPVFTRNSAHLQSISIPGTKTLGLCFVLYALTFALTGYIISVLLDGIYGVDDPPFFLITGIFAVSWVAGIITPGAPAGLGVREAVLIALLQPLYGGVTVLGVTLALRVVTMIGDVLVFAAAFAIPDKTAQRCDVAK